MFATRGPLRDGDPERIGDILIQSRLGAGGMGVVYEGRTTEGRPVAVKVLRNGDWSTPESLAALTREARAIGSIKSPHVAELLASDVEGEYPYLVLELVEGQPLNKAVPDGGFDTETATVIARQVLEGLSAAHKAGVFHQDLKPSNVVLSDAGVKLIDFGVAAIADAGTQTSLTLGTSGDGSGTMAWLAPEQIRGAPGSQKSDVFAWGLVATYAATGRNPFGSGRPEAVMYAIVNDEPDLGRVDRKLGDAILAALNKDPDTRPTTEQLQAMLVPASSTATPVPVPTGATDQGPQIDRQHAENEPSRTQPTRRRLVSIGVGIGVVGLLLGSVGGYYGSTSGQDSTASPSTVVESPSSEAGASEQPDTAEQTPQEASPPPPDSTSVDRVPLGETVELGYMEVKVAEVTYAPSDKAANSQEAKVTIEFRHVGEDPTLEGSCDAWTAYDTDGQRRDSNDYDGFSREVLGGQESETWTSFLLPADRKLDYVDLSCDAAGEPSSESVEASVR